MATLHMAGSDGFVTEGERWVADELRKLPDDWVVIANKMLPVPGAASREIDFIVAGDNLVFVLDDKGWTGQIHGTDQEWVFPGGRSERSPLNKQETTAKIVAGFLRNKTYDWDQQNAELVVAGIVLSRAETRPRLSDPRASRAVMLLDEIRERLLAWDEAGPVPRYRGADVAEPGYVRRSRKKIVDALFDLRARPKVPSRINDYGILGTIEGPPGAKAFSARHPHLGERELIVYDTQSDETQRALLWHEIQTLRSLDGTGLVPDISDPFSWSEQFTVVPIVPPTGSTIAALPAPTSVDDAREMVRFAAATFRALDRLHTANVVHRALNPDRVTVSTTTMTGHGAAGQDPRATFTRFFAARNPGGTIGNVLGGLGIIDPYAAPEVIAFGPDGYGIADRTSDTYTLALIWLERLSGQRLQALRPDAFPAGGETAPPRTGVRYDVRVPAADAGWQYVPEDLVKELRDFFGRVLTAGGLAVADTTASRRLTAEECAARLEAMVAGTPERTEPTFTTYEVGQELDGRYTVERLLGAGATAHTYLVSDRVDGGRYAMKRLIHPSLMGESIAASEFRTLKELNHRSIPRVYDTYLPGDPFHMKMAYVEGRELHRVIPEIQGNLDRWRPIARDLLSAVAYLESNGVQHRDIKPDNVIVRDDDVTVLVDFGISSRLGTTIGPAGTHGYLPPEALTAATPPDSLDRFAAAVVLFETLFGRKPFAGDAGFILQPVTIDDLNIDDPVLRAVGRLLLNAVAVDIAIRPASASLLSSALEIALEMIVPSPVITPGGTGTAGPDEPAHPVPKINPTVASLRALFRNSDQGNADNRGLDSDFARETYVPTRLDQRVLPATLEARPKVVFLSGNPGDGKTAFLEKVRERLREAAGTEVSADASGWEWTLDGHTFRACYDASESHDGLTADEQVIQRFCELAGDAEPTANLTVLLAINDGRFVSLLRAAAPDYGWLTRAASGAQRRLGDLTPGGVWYLDLKRRSAVGLQVDRDDPSLLRKALDALVASDRWSACRGCSAFDRCPIRRNAAALAATGATAPADRLEHLMRISHLRGVRHLTIRDIRSGLAYLITAGRGCEDVHAALDGRGQLPAEYWRTMFSTGDETDNMLGQFRQLDPARSPQPFLERYLFFHRDGTERSRAARTALFADGVDIPMSTLGGTVAAGEADGSDFGPTVAETEEAIAWVSAVKRRLFFHGHLPDDSRRLTDGTRIPAVPWVSLLPYREFAGEFINALSHPEEADRLSHDLLLGITRSDGVKVGFDEAGMALRVAHSDENRMTVVKWFPASEFTIAVDGIAGEALETIPTALWLIHGPSHGRLRVTLDLFETLWRLADGQEPDTEELRPLMEDLVGFKSIVARQQANDFHLIEDDRRRHLLTQDDGQIILKTDVGSVGAGREAAE